MSTTSEIARILRTTEDNAARFIERVRAEVGEPIEDEDLVAIIGGINPRQLSLPKVIHAVRDYHKRVAAREAKRASRRPARASAPGDSDENSAAEPEEPEARGRRAIAPVRARASSSLVQRISEVLQRNWSRAEREGLSPTRVDAEVFIDNVRDYTDPRDATHARILAALEELDRQDVMITATVAADRVREMA
jgi:hypothetical protein